MVCVGSQNLDPIIEDTGFDSSTQMHRSSPQGPSDQQRARVPSPTTQPTPQDRIAVPDRKPNLPIPTTQREWIILTKQREIEYQARRRAALIAAKAKRSAAVINNRLNNSLLRKRMEPVWMQPEREMLASMMAERPRGDMWDMCKRLNGRFEGRAVPLSWDKSGVHPGRPVASLHIELLLYAPYYGRGNAPPKEFFGRDAAVVRDEEMAKVKRVFADPEEVVLFQEMIGGTPTVGGRVSTVGGKVSTEVGSVKKPRWSPPAVRGPLLRPIRKRGGGRVGDERAGGSSRDERMQRALSIAMNSMQIEERGGADREMKDDREMNID